jgi:hypothetical protein
MAENETPMETPTPQTGVPPTPTSGETSPPPQGLNLDSKITFDGKEVSVGDLINENRKISDLEEYQKNATTLMGGTDVPQEKRESAMRYLLSREGYLPDQIEAHIAEARKMTMDQQPDQQQAAPQQDFSQERARIAEMERQQTKMSVELLKKDLDTAVGRVMEDNPKIKTLVEKSKQLGGEEGLEQRIRGIREEVRRSTMDNMRTRKSRGETFDNSWFIQETTKAADAVYERIRSVIGDPDKIQRAPETASEADSFVNKPPVADPIFERGDNMGTASTKSHDFTTDTLARLADDIGRGGQSKI